MGQQIRTPRPGAEGPDAEEPDAEGPDGGTSDAERADVGASDAERADVGTSGPERPDVETRLQALEERIARLESAPTTSTESTPGDVGDVGDTFWALTGLTQRVPEDGGAVMMVGAVTAPNGNHAEWQYADTVEALFAEDFADHAEVLSALAHPVRLTLLQRLLSGAETVSDLHQTGEFGTTGQIYHHLRQLVAAGWLRTVRHGTYEVPAHRLVPLLTMLMGAQR